jgi:hypothetical protein
MRLEGSNWQRYKNSLVEDVGEIMRERGREKERESESEN